MDACASCPFLQPTASFRERIEAIEARLKAHRVSVTRMLRQADVNSTTWTRWKAGTTAAPRGQVWARVEAAVDALAPVRQSEAA